LNLIESLRWGLPKIDFDCAVFGRVLKPPEIVRKIQDTRTVKLVGAAFV